MKPSDALRQSLASLISQAEAAVAAKQAPIRARIALLSNIKVDDRQHEVAEQTREAVTADNPVEVLRRAASILVDMELQQVAADLGKAAADTLKPELKALEAPITMCNNLHYATAALFSIAQKVGTLAQTAGDSYTDHSLARHHAAQAASCRQQAEAIGKATGIDAQQYILDLDAFVDAVANVEGVV